MNSTLGSVVPLAMFKVVYVTHKASILPLRRILDNESFLLLLKSTFLAFKKSFTSWTNSKKNSSFFRDPFFYRNDSNGNLNEKKSVLQAGGPNRHAKNSKC